MRERREQRGCGWAGTWARHIQATEGSDAVAGVCQCRCRWYDAHSWMYLQWRSSCITSSSTCFLALHASPRAIFSGYRTPNSNRCLACCRVPQTRETNTDCAGAITQARNSERGYAGSSVEAFVTDLRARKLVVEIARLPATCTSAYQEVMLAANLFALMRCSARTCDGAGGGVCLHGEHALLQTAPRACGLMATHSVGGLQRLGVHVCGGMSGFSSALCVLDVLP